MVQRETSQPYAPPDGQFLIAPQCGAGPCARKEPLLADAREGTPALRPWTRWRLTRSRDKLLIPCLELSWQVEGWRSVLEGWRNVVWYDKYSERMALRKS